MICPGCNEDTVIKVGTSDGVPFFSCHTESCVHHARLLVLTADFGFKRHDAVLHELMAVIENVDSDEVFAKVERDNEQTDTD